LPWHVGFGLIQEGDDSCSSRFRTGVPDDQLLAHVKGWNADLPDVESTGKVDETGESGRVGSDVVDGDSEGRAPGLEIRQKRLRCLAMRAAFSHEDLEIRRAVLCVSQADWGSKKDAERNGDPNPAERTFDSVSGEAEY
jgi:hypothetical protein